MTETLVTSAFRLSAQAEAFCLLPSALLRKLSILVAVALLSVLLPLLNVSKGWGQDSSSAEISSFIEQLKNDSDWRIRAQAASELGEINQENSTIIAALIEALSDEDEVVRLRATFALVNIGLPTVPKLIETLNNQNLAVHSSAAFALQEIGLPTLPMLEKALKHEDKLIRSHVSSVLSQIAADFQKQVDTLSISDLKQASSDLEPALKFLESFQEPLDPTTLTKFGFQKENVASIRSSINVLRNEIRNRVFAIAFKIIVLTLVTLLLIGVIILWRRPEILLRLSRGIIQARQKQNIINQTLAKVQQFLNQAGTNTNRQGKNGLLVTSAPGRLKPYTPLPVKLVTEQPIDQDVTELVEQSTKLKKQNQQQAGMILYQEPPDTLFRMRMAEVRLRDHFVLIPMPLAAVEQALLEQGKSAGILAHYTDRYLPGADLFDDRNAIGDTLSFFGRGELLHRLGENLQRNQGIGIFGLRKSGKTSILLQLGFALQRHPVIHIDLQPYGGRQFYGTQLFNQILQQLSQLLGKYTLESITNFQPFEPQCPACEFTSEFLQRVIKLVKVINKAGYELPILLFLDEIERIIPTDLDSKERAEEFNACFGAFRALSQEQRVLSLLIADVHPDCNRINQWRQAGVPTNPVFSFFKEVFLSPFSPEETTRMLTDIGKLMGVTFDQETLTAIHRESGGHPFIARQLASLLCKKLAASEKGQIPWLAAQRYLNKPFAHSAVLKDYCSQNIWADLKKRNFNSAIAILRLLACNENSVNGISEQVIKERLINILTKSECLDALLWLEAVGLVEHQESEDNDYYRSKVPLMSRWLRMQMKEEEMRQWQLQ